MLHDVRYAIRTFSRQPGFVAVAILTLALAIGANTAIFSVVNAVLLRPLPFRDPGRLVMVWESNPLIKGFLSQRLPVALKNFEAWKTESGAFDGMAAYADDFATLTGLDKPERVEYGAATTGFFRLFGVDPAIGRNFASDENSGAKTHVAILTDGFWHKQFGGDRGVLGRTITLDATAYTIIGVLPDWFHLPGMWEGSDQKKPAMWVPLNEHPSTQREQESRTNFVYARLRQDSSLAQARGEMSVISHRLQQQYPRMNHLFSANVSPIGVEDVGPTMSRTVLALQIAVGFVLLIACANIANLLLTKTASRSKEVAVRVALGASRGRLLRQNLTEGLLLSLVSSAAGVLIGWWLMRAITAVAPEDNYHLQHLDLDPVVLGFTIAAAIISGLLFGSAPAIYFAGQQIGAVLAKAGRSASSGISQGVRKGLVIAETALAIVLLVGAGLMIRSMYKVLGMDPGFRPDHVLTLHVPLSESKYNSPATVGAFCDQMLDRIAGLPGVQAAAIATGLPMLDNMQVSSFHLPGESTGDDARAHVADVKRVSEGYFETLRTPVLHGRAFTRQEAESGAKVVIVNDALAHQIWPAQDAVGKVMLFGGPEHQETRRVVGVVASVHQMGLDTETRPEVFMPSRNIAGMSVMARTAGDPTHLAAAVSGVITALDKAQPVTDVQSLEHQMREGLERRRFNMILFAAFGCLAVLLAAIGIYGVLSFIVTQRTHEIGIRMALGAKVSDILRLVLGHGLGLAGIGIAIGSIAAIGLTRLMQTLLFGVSPTDPVTFVAGVLTLATVALLASYIPARRAARVDPVQSLRTE